MGKWFETQKRAYLLDFQMPDSSDQMPIGQARNLRATDPQEIVRRLHEAGVQALYVHAKDNQGNCYYDTLYGHKHSGIGERDLMREYSVACRKVGMTILYYVQLSRERRGNLDYPAIGADGKPVLRMTQIPLLPEKDVAPVMCLNGGGREYMKNVVRELAERYDFDGYWLDCYGWWGRVNPCYCDTCKAKYREDTGCDLPEAGDNSSLAWKRYLKWRRRLNNLILHEIISTIRAANPQLTVTHNGSSFAIWADARFSDADDFVSHEFHYNEGYGWLALETRMQEALKPGVPFEIEVWRFFNLLGNDAHMVRGYQVRPAPQLFTEMATVTANGGFVQYYDQIRPDGGLDQLSLDRMKAAFDLVREREPWLRTTVNGQRRVSYAGLLWSKETEAFAQSEHARAHHCGLEGAHDALMERRMLHSVVCEREVATGATGGLKVIVAPSAVCMDDGVAAGLREYVRGGGGLVATYRTSLADPMGNPRENFLLADVFGCDYLEPLSFTYGFMKYDKAGPLTQGIELGWPMTLWHKLQLKVALRHGAEGHGCIINPMRGMHMGHPPQEETPYPAAVLNRYGKGRVVYFPQPLGYAYYDYGHPDLRALLVNAVRWAAGEAPAVEVECPETVEIVLWEDPKGGRILHLVNRTAGGPARTKASVITQAIPVHDLVVTAHFPLKKAMLQPEGRELDIRTAADGFVFTVPRVDIHSIVTLR